MLILELLAGPGHVSGQCDHVVRHSCFDLGDGCLRVLEDRSPLNEGLNVRLGSVAGGEGCACVGNQFEKLEESLSGIGVSRLKSSERLRDQLSH